MIIGINIQINNTNHLVNEQFRLKNAISFKYDYFGTYFNYYLISADNLNFKFFILYPIDFKKQFQVRSGFYRFETNFLGIDEESFRINFVSYEFKGDILKSDQYEKRN